MKSKTNRKQSKTKIKSQSNTTTQDDPIDSFSDYHHIPISLVEQDQDQIKSNSTSHSEEEHQPSTTIQSQPQDNRTSSSSTTDLRMNNTQNHSKPTKEKLYPLSSPNPAFQHLTHGFQSSFLALLASLWSLLTWPIRFLMMIILPHTVGGLVACVVLSSIVYLLGLSCWNWIERLRPTQSLNFLFSSLTSFSSPMIYLYCSILRGPFCRSKDSPSAENLAQIARTVTGTARQASDIFDSVIQLSDPNHLGLHQTETLELAYAVRWSSELTDKDLLGNELIELSELTREIKDELVGLNAQGLNAFSFIAHEFSRLGDLIDWVQSGQKKYTSQTIMKNLDLLFSHLSSELNKLLKAIERLIPLAFRSTHLGIQVSERLHQERYQLLHKKTHQGLWKKLLDLTTYSGQQLNQDLLLTSQSIENLRQTWLKLEEIRTELLTYRNNVANFKASFTAWHLADHGLSPEDELFSMRDVIGKFQGTIELVKAHSRLSSSHHSVPASPKLDTH